MSERYAWMTTVLRRGLTLALVASVAAFAACGDDDGLDLDDLDDLTGDGDNNIVGDGSIAGMRILGQAQDVLPDSFPVGTPLVLSAIPTDASGADISSGGDLALLDFFGGVTWESSDPSVIELQALVVGADASAIITAVLKSPGTATLTASHEGFSDSIELTVTAL